MNMAAILLGALLSTLFGAIFHLIFGGGLGRLVLFIFLSWIGFWSGHFLALQFGWTFASVGALRLGVATSGSLICLVLGLWLSLRPPPPESH